MSEYKIVANRVVGEFVDKNQVYSACICNRFGRAGSRIYRRIKEKYWDAKDIIVTDM